MPTTTRRQVLAAGLSLTAAAPIGANTGSNMKDEKTRTTQQLQVGAQTGIESLVRTERAVPPPGPGEVLIATKAAALNYRDLMITEGRYGARKQETLVPLGDGGGEVLAVGEQVSAVAVGDRVSAPHFTGWIDGEFSPSVFSADLGNSIDGWLTQIARLPAHALVKIPKPLSYESAAALGAAGITAWTVIETLGRIKAGDVVLTLGTGGVSIMALQLAKMNGATVAITSSSDEKLAVAQRLGADITVNYRKNPSWEQAILEQTGGVDIVVETVGLATLSQSIACCAPNGCIGLLGGLGGRPHEPPNMGGLMLNNITLKGITSGSRKMFADLLRACAGNGVVPHVDRTFGFSEAEEAYAYLAKGRHVGKIVVTFDS